eukprot:RCo035731
MTEFQKASQAVQSITTRLDALSSRLAEDPANEFEEQNAYFCMNTELMDVEHILSEGSSLSSKIHGFKERASETDPNKQIYGPGMATFAIALTVRHGRRILFRFARHLLCILSLSLSLVILLILTLAYTGQAHHF